MSNLHIDASGVVYGQRSREDLEKATEPKLIMQLLGLKNQQLALQAQIRETRTSKKEGVKGADEELRQLEQQYRELMAEMEKTQARLDEIHQEKLAPRTPEDKPAARPAVERFDTVEITGPAPEEDEGEELDEEMLELAQELIEAEE